MKLVDFYISLYGRFYCERLPYWVLTPFRRLIRRVANFHIPRYFERNIHVQHQTEKGLIVSLTTFPVRIGNVWQVVECMLRQTVLPEKIILWLSNDQFSNMDALPKKLVNMQNGIFEIRLVDRDIRSHKKYFYVCKEYPNDLIFLVDDDIYYDSHIIERSLLKYHENPHSVICNYGSKITFRDNGSHLSYSQWGSMIDDDNLFFGSGGGTLFKPTDLHKDLTKIEVALKLAPIADDVWLNAMARLNGIKVYHTSDRILLPIHNKMDITLSSLNNGESQNDKQIEAVENYYGKCFDCNYIIEK